MFFWNINIIPYFFYKKKLYILPYVVISIYKKGIN